MYLSTYSSKLSHIINYFCLSFINLSSKFNSLNYLLYKNFLLWNEGLYFDFLQKKYLDYFLLNFLIYSTYLFNDRYLFENFIYYPSKILIFFNTTYSIYLVNFTTLMLILIGSIFFILTLVILLI